MVEVESRLCCSLVEAELGRYGLGDFGGEMTITSGSVDTAGLAGRTSLSGVERPKGRRPASRFEGIAKMLSSEDQSSVVSALESGRSGQKQKII